MDIVNKTNTLFDNVVHGKSSKSKTKPQQNPSIVPNIIPKEARALEYQMNKYLHAKNKGKDESCIQKVSFKNMLSSSFTDMADIDVFLATQNDIKRRKQKTWKSLDVSHKWDLLKQFYNESNEKFDEKKLKHMLLRNALNVIYDKEADKVKSVTIL